MARSRRGGGDEGRGAGRGRGVGRPPRVPREPDGSDRLQRQKDQITALAGIVHQLVQQQTVAPAAPVPPVPPSAPPPVQEPAEPVVPPAAPVLPVVIAPATATTPGAAPEAATVGDPPVAAVGIASRPETPAAVADVDQAERTRIKAVLIEFKKFKPRVFHGKNDDHWAMVQWIDHMEKLFRDLYTEERDKVHVAVHCLEGGASKWWNRHLQSNYEGLPEPSWCEFKTAIYHRYLKETTKEGLERELENIKQGDRSVRDYEEEFLRIADLIPQAVREERRKVRLFSQGLRHEIRRQLSSHRIVDFDDCVERCLSVEADIMIYRAERDAAERNKRKKRSFPGDGGGSLNSGKPPRHPRNQDQATGTPTGSQQRGPRPCVFCGGPHRAITCDQRHGGCYRCGQAGHIVANCPQRFAPVQSTVSAPVVSSQRQSPAPSTSSYGRSPPPHQSDGTRQIAGGRVYALTAPDDPPEDIPAGNTKLVKMERGRREGRDDFFAFGDPFPGFSVGRPGSSISSFFGFGGRDPFDDPFFTRPFGSLMGPSIFGPNVFAPNRSMFGETTDAQFLGEAPPLPTKSGGPVIRELSDDEDKNEGEQKHSGRLSEQPVVQEPDEETEEMKNLHVQYGGEFNRASVAQPQARTYAFRSSTVTYGGPNGAYYTSSTTRRTGGDGITLEESKEADATTGRAAHRISRGIRDKGHSVTRRLGSDGRVDTTQKLHNLNEYELAGFEETWRGNARQNLPGWNPGFDMLDSNNSRSRRSTEGRDQDLATGWALPAAEQAHHFRRMGSSARNGSSQRRV